MLLEESANRAPVKAAITLRPRRPYRRSLAAVQHSELNAGEIGRPAHDPAKGIDLAGDRALRDAADGRIARHLTDRLERAGDEGDSRAESRGGDSGLGARVSGADHEYIERVFVRRRHVVRERRGARCHAFKLTAH